MQSRLATAPNFRHRLLSSVIHRRFPPCLRASSTPFPTADPAIHSETIDPEEVVSVTGKQPQQEENKGKDPFKSTIPPFASSPKLENNEATPPVVPTTQQKRRTHAAVENVSCVGLDGRAFIWTKEGQLQMEQEVDDDEYYKTHRPSPLSQLEVADTRKPITRATAGTAGDHEVGNVIGWKEEQLDTAEEALQRAARTWKESAMRGDPDSPQSRVLRALRGE